MRRPSGRCEDDRHHVTRRDGERWNVRPHRWWLCPLLGRREMAGAALREDAVRPGVADPRLPARLPRLRRGALEAGRRGDRRVRVARTSPSRLAVSISAEDADSPDEHGHGHEGLFHTWTIDEVRDVLGADADIALEWYEFTEGGNFEGRTIPTRLQHRGELARPPEVESARQRLFDARAARRRPLLDDKVLTEWNGLMLASLAEAAASLDRARLARGCRRERPIPRRQPSWTDDRWHRSWQAEGQPQARHAALGRRPRGNRRCASPGWRKRLVMGRGSPTLRASPTRCSTTSGTSTTAGCSPPPTTANNSLPARRT